MGRSHLCDVLNLEASTAHHGQWAEHSGSLEELIETTLGHARPPPLECLKTRVECLIDARTAMNAGREGRQKMSKGNKDVVVAWMKLRA